MVKRIIGVILGTYLLGLGIALCNISNFGVNPYAALIFTIADVLNTSYSVSSIIINLIFFIVVIVFIKKQINVGTIINLVFSGVFCDLMLWLFNVINLNTENIILRILYGILGLVLTAFSIAFYFSANLGIAPYDALPLIITKKIKKISFKYARIIVDSTSVLIVLIIGIFIKKFELIGVFTLLSFVLTGPLIAYFNKLAIKYYYKDEKTRLE